jgi:hypothetical protein
MHFTVTTEGQNRLNLQHAAEAQWIPAHYMPQEAAEFVLDQFRRMVVLAFCRFGTGDRTPKCQNAT